MSAGQLIAWTDPTPEQCPVMVSDHDSRFPTYRQCPNAPKPHLVRPLYHTGLGQPTRAAVCGMHAGVHDRAVARQNQQATARLEREQAKDAAMRAADKVTAAGIRAEPHWVHNYRGPGHYDGRVCVDPAELLRALGAELAEFPEPKEAPA